MYMRMMEKFSGCRVLAYCVMSNHFHVLLEVPPLPEGGISDEELLKRLSAIYGEGMWRWWPRNSTKHARQGGKNSWLRSIHASPGGCTT